MPELFEKTIGSAGAVCLFALFSVWIVDLELFYKLLATGTMALLVVAIAGFLLLKKLKLDRTRKEQLRQHRESRSAL